MSCMKRLMLFGCVEKANWTSHKKLQPNSNMQVIPTDFSGRSGWLEEDIFRQSNHLYLELSLFLIVSILKSSFRNKKLEITCFLESIQFHLINTIYFF